MLDYAAHEETGKIFRGRIVYLPKVRPYTLGLVTKISSYSYYRATRGILLFVASLKGNAEWVKKEECLLTNRSSDIRLAKAFFPTITDKNNKKGTVMRVTGETNVIVTVNFGNDRIVDLALEDVAFLPVEGLDREHPPL